MLSDNLIRSDTGIVIPINVHGTCRVYYRVGGGAFTVDREKCKAMTVFFGRERTVYTVYNIINGVERFGTGWTTSDSIIITTYTPIQYGGCTYSRFSIYSYGAVSV